MAYRITSKTMVAGGITLIAIVLLSPYLTSTDFKSMCNNMETNYGIIENVTGQYHVLLKTGDECVRIKTTNDKTTVYSTSNRILAEWDYEVKYFKTYGTDMWVKLNRKASQIKLSVKEGTNQVNITRITPYYASASSGNGGTLTETIILNARPKEYVKMDLLWTPGSDGRARANQITQRFSKLNITGYNDLGYIWLDKDNYLSWIESKNQTLFAYSEGIYSYLPYVAKKGIIHIDPSLSELKDGEVDEDYVFKFKEKSKSATELHEVFTIVNPFPKDIPLSYFSTIYTKQKSIELKDARTLILKNQRFAYNQSYDYACYKEYENKSCGDTNKFTRMAYIDNWNWVDATKDDVIPASSEMDVRFVSTKKATLGKSSVFVSYRADFSKLEPDLQKKLSSNKLLENKSSWWDSDYTYKKAFQLNNLDAVTTVRKNATYFLLNGTNNIGNVTGQASLVFNDTTNISFFKNTSYLIFKTIKSIPPGGKHNYTLYWGDGAAPTMTISDLKKGLLHYEDCADITDMVNPSSAWSVTGGYCIKSAGEVQSGGCGIHNFLLHITSKADGETLNVSGDKIVIRANSTLGSNTHGGPIWNANVTSNCKACSAGMGYAYFGWAVGSAFYVGNGSCVNNDQGATHPASYNDQLIMWHKSSVAYISKTRWEYNVSVSQGATVANLKRIGPIRMGRTAGYNYTWGNGYGFWGSDANNQVKFDNMWIYRSYNDTDWSLTEYGVESEAAPAAGKNRTKVGILQPSYSAQPGWTKIFNMTFNVSTNDSGDIDCALYRNKTLVGSNVTITNMDYYTINYVFGQNDYNKSHNFSVTCHTDHNASNKTRIIWKDTWGNESWRYRERFVVENSGANILSGYPVNISVNTEKLIRGKLLNSNCSNMIFRLNNTKNNTKLNYWIYTNDSMYKNGCGATNTQIYVNVTLAAASKTTFFMYAGGDNNAKRSNGNLVFPVFDDFEQAGSNISRLDWQRMWFNDINSMEHIMWADHPTYANRTSYYGTGNSKMFKLSGNWSADTHHTAVAILNYSKPTYKSIAYATIIPESANYYWIHYGLAADPDYFDADENISDTYGFLQNLFAVGRVTGRIPIQYSKHVQAFSGKRLVGDYDVHGLINQTRPGENMTFGSLGQKTNMTNFSGQIGVREIFKLNSWCNKTSYVKNITTGSTKPTPQIFSSNISLANCLLNLSKVSYMYFSTRPLGSAVGMYIDNVFIQRYSENVSFISKTYEPLDAPIRMIMMPRCSTIYEDGYAPLYPANNTYTNHGAWTDHSVIVTNSTYKEPATDGELNMDYKGSGGSDFPTTYNISINHFDVVVPLVGRYNLTYNITDWNGYSSTNSTDILWFYPLVNVTRPNGDLWDRKNNGTIKHEVRLLNANFTYYYLPISDYRLTVNNDYCGTINTTLLGSLQIAKKRPATNPYEFEWNFSTVDSGKYNLLIVYTYYKNKSINSQYTNLTVIHDLMNISPTSFNFNTTFNKITWNADGTVNATNVTLNNYNGTDTITTTIYNDTFSAWNTTRFINNSMVGKIKVAGGNLILNASGASGGHASFRTRDTFLEDAYVTYKIRNTTYFVSSELAFYLYKNVSGTMRELYFQFSGVTSRLGKNIVYKHVITAIDNGNVTVKSYANGTIIATAYSTDSQWVNSSDSFSMGIRLVDGGTIGAINVSDFYVNGINNYTSTIGNYTHTNITIGANSSYTPIGVRAYLNASANSAVNYYLSNSSANNGKLASVRNLTTSEKLVCYSAPCTLYAWENWIRANGSSQNNRDILFDYDTCAECDN